MDNQPPRRQGPSDRRVVEPVRRSRPGDAVVRVTRPKFSGFARRGAGRLEASLTLEEPRGPVGKLWRVLVGTPIHSELEINERLTKKKALAVFSSDALSSVAYTPQATLLILLAAGAGAIFWSLPISIAVVLLLAAVVFSYRQTTYAFLACMYVMIGVGLYLQITGNLDVPPPPALPPPTEPLTLFLLLRAFAVGSAVMTGTEAISNGIPAFKPPESRNAAQTIVTMATILALMFLGLSFLIVNAQIIPSRAETVISLLAHAVFGESVLYYVLQFSAVLILVLAA